MIDSKIVLISILILTMVNCSNRSNEKPTQDIKRAYQEINYHQESFILFEFIKYYKEDFGKYPNKIEDIKLLFDDETVDYSGVNKSNIDDNIRDPFSGKPYKYVLLDEGSFVLYSVGADGANDNQSVKESEAFDFIHYSVSEKKGDILIYHLENDSIVNDFTDISKFK